jgi:hypothetical protein
MSFWHFYLQDVFTDDWNEFDESEHREVNFFLKKEVFFK